MRTQTAAFLTTAILGVIFAAAPASAQHYGQPQPAQPGINSPPHYQPFGDLGVEYDLQLFAPPIIEDYGDDAFAANYGWYLQYDRMQLHVSRPERTGQFDGVNAASEVNFDLDRTWGNRYDLGYMTEENSGWNFGAMKINSPNSFVLETIPGFISADIELEALDATTSLNTVRLNSFEISKTFRLPPTEHGLIREPFFGVRYVKLQDSYQRTTRTFVDAPANEFFLNIDIDGIPGVEQILTIREQDRTISDVSILGNADNDMLGPQLGTRWYLDRGHWRISAEARAFAMQNLANFGAQGRIETVTIRNQRVVGVLPPDPLTPVPDPVQFILDQTFQFINPPLNDKIAEFVWGGELRLETQYHLTREINLRFGLEFLSLGQGVVRSPVTPNATNVFDLFGATEDMFAVGYTMGIEVNR